LRQRLSMITTRRVLLAGDTKTEVQLVVGRLNES
jgi:hypothetical protein